jgi:hypothetical protein
VASEKSVSLLHETTGRNKSRILAVVLCCLSLRCNNFFFLKVFNFFSFELFFNTCADIKNKF